MHKGSSSYKVTATVFSELCNDHQRLELTGGYAPRKLIGNQHQIIRSRNRPARFISFEDLTMKIMMLHLHSFLKVNYIWDLVQFAVTEIWGLGKVFQAAIWYGLVVHFRVYPIIYALPIILALDPRFFQSGLKPKLESWSSSQAKTPQSSNKVTDGYGLWTALKALFTIRRIIQLVLIFRFAQDLPFCFFVQTVAFVAFNKVITTHYFVWFFCLLPLILPWSSMKLKWEGLCCILVWMGAQSHWLLWGYLLEFRGKNVFIELWLTGLVFLAANTFILVMIIRRHKYSPAFDSMKIALKFE